MSNLEKWTPGSLTKARALKVHQVIGKYGSIRVCFQVVQMMSHVVSAGRFFWIKRPIIIFAELRGVRYL
jgi:hypothetical protein